MFYGKLQNISKHLNITQRRLANIWDEIFKSSKKILWKTAFKKFTSSTFEYSFPFDFSFEMTWN